MHEKIGLWLLIIIVSAAVARALTSPGTFISRATAAIASILFAIAFTPLVVEIIGVYYKVSLFDDVSSAVGASLAIIAEPIIRHMYALALNPSAILGVVRSAKEITSPRAEAGGISRSIFFPLA